MKKLRMGLVGVGIHGSRYARHLLRGDVPGAVLAAICRRDEAAGRRFAEQHGVDFVGDPTDMAQRRGIDAVVAVLPPDLHVRIADACLDAGRPVLVEKPMAADAPAARDLERRVERTGSLLMVAHTLRFDAVVEAVRRETERIGQLRLVAMGQRFEPTDRDWIDQPGRGGAILNTGVHGFDLFRYLTGAEPVTVTAERRSLVTRKTEDEFACVIGMEPGAVLATLDNLRSTEGRCCRIETVGSRAQVRADTIHRTLSRIEATGETRLASVPASHTVARVLRAFTRCLREDSEPAVTAADGRAAVEMADACALSARLGRRVELEEVRRDG